MTRDEAYHILTKHLKNQNLIKHCLACEAAMKAIYQYLHKDDFSEEEQKKWGITGLLHDADYEKAKDMPEKHGLLLFDFEKGTIPDDIVHAIQAHNYEGTKIMPESDMDWAIRCCDQLTGLIVACALVHPEKKLAPLTPEFIAKRMKEKSFAKGAMREPILQCEEKLGIKLEEFIALTLSAMQKIHKSMGL